MTILTKLTKSTKPIKLKNNSNSKNRKGEKRIKFFRQIEVGHNVDNTITHRFHDIFNVSVFFKNRESLFTNI